MTVSLLHDFSSQYKGDYAYHINQDAGWFALFPTSVLHVEPTIYSREAKGSI